MSKLSQPTSTTSNSRLPLLHDKIPASSLLLLQRLDPAAVDRYAPRDNPPSHFPIPQDESSNPRRCRGYIFSARARALRIIRIIRLAHYVFKRVWPRRAAHNVEYQRCSRARECDVFLYFARASTYQLPPINWIFFRSERLGYEKYKLCVYYNVVCRCRLDCLFIDKCVNREYKLKLINVAAGDFIFKWIIFGIAYIRGCVNKEQLCVFCDPLFGSLTDIENWIISIVHARVNINFKDLKLKLYD